MIVKGMGNIVTDSFGRTVDCDYFMNTLTTPQCWQTSSNLAVPPAPTGSALTVPPASGESANATVNSLLNQQLVNQQSINATDVTSSWWDTFTGGLSNYINPTTMTGVLVIAGLFVLVAVSGGSPRRYGR